MPLYDYACTACGRVHEVRHGFDETYDRPCEACGAPMRRVFNPAPVLFKGSGFYVTDSRRSPAPGKPEKAEKPKDETGKRQGRLSAAAERLQRAPALGIGGLSRSERFERSHKSRETDLHRLRAIDRERAGSAGERRSSHRDAMIPVRLDHRRTALGRAPCDP